MFRSAVLLTAIAVCGACEENKASKKYEAYKGPIEEINNVQMLYSEGALMKVRMTTPRQLRYLNEDRKYPQEVHIDFYGPTGTDVVTTLRSDSGRYDKAKDLYTVLGNVVVVNKEKQETLETDVLNWNPNTKKVFTDRPVTITSKLTGERLKGIGLDANQDFSRYAIRKPTGVFNVEGTPF
ncbi:LPS export ABC transporter periplasmic protein LptC [Arsenicibacter rosenii]|uniref:LPS export ABC transporter periplasmic protein LptC n=1 Tax=Arsenicibacter rosenii TaxID=1750698 RepID=UPI001E5AB0EB|nr:LPS export ABC transporter periplasmic protein LptC [Arsenicibacter rosenii]